MHSFREYISMNILWQIYSSWTNQTLNIAHYIICSYTFMLKAHDKLFPRIWFLLWQNISYFQNAHNLFICLLKKSVDVCHVKFMFVLLLSQCIYFLWIFEIEHIDKKDMIMCKFQISFYNFIILKSSTRLSCYFSQHLQGSSKHTYQYIHQLFSQY